MKTVEDYKEELSYLYKKVAYGGESEWVKERIEEVKEVLKQTKGEQ